MSPRNRPLSALVLSVVLVLGVGACGDDDLTPEEARAQRVEERLKLSFTDEQVDCMMEQFGEAVLISLDGEGKMPQGGAELDEFSAVTQECVVNAGGSTPEAGEPTETTTSTTTASSTTDDATTAPETTTESTSSTSGEGSGGGPDTRPETESNDDGGDGNNGRGNDGDDRGNSNRGDDGGGDDGGDDDGDD